MTPSNTVAKAALFFQDKLLLLTRSTSMAWRPGGYDLVGGKIDPSEDIYKGLIREISEEIGISVKREDLSLVYTATRVIGGSNVVSLYFVGYLTDKAISLSQEHIDYRWVGIDEAIDIDDHPTQNAFLAHIKMYHLLAQPQPGKVQ
jgi:8-oxo-dGTP pyrophosphatase MutT (NUDIX family)